MALRGFYQVQLGMMTLRLVAMQKGGFCPLGSSSAQYGDGRLRQV